MERRGDRGEKWKNVSPAGVFAVWICCMEKFHISQQNVKDIVTPYQCSLLARVRGEEGEEWKLKNSWIFVLHTGKQRKADVFGYTKNLLRQSAFYS